MKEKKDPPLFIIIITIIVIFIIIATIFTCLQWLNSKSPIAFGLISWIVIGLGIYWWKYYDKDS